METVNILKLKSSEIIKLVLDLPHLLDDRIIGGAQVQFRSLEHRLSAMLESDQYPGYLELATVAYLIKRQLFIYEERRHSYYLHAVIPLTAYKNRTPIRLCHTFDTDTKDGHYELLTMLIENNSEPFMLNMDSTNIFEKVLAGLNPDDCKVTLLEILAPNYNESFNNSFLTSSDNTFHTQSAPTSYDGTVHVQSVPMPENSVQTQSVPAHDNPVQTQSVPTPEKSCEISCEIMTDLGTTKPAQIALAVYPVTYYGSKQRRFQQSWSGFNYYHK